MKSSLRPDHKLKPNAYLSTAAPVDTGQSHIRLGRAPEHTGTHITISVGQGWSWDQSLLLFFAATGPNEPHSSRDTANPKKATAERLGVRWQ